MRCLWACSIKPGRVTSLLLLMAFLPSKSFSERWQRMGGNFSIGNFIFSLQLSSAIFTQSYKTFFHCWPICTACRKCYKTFSFKNYKSANRPIMPFKHNCPICNLWKKSFITFAAGCANGSPTKKSFIRLSLKSCSWLVICLWVRPEAYPIVALEMCFNRVDLSLTHKN